MIKDLQKIDFDEKVKEISPFKKGDDSTFVRDDKSMRREELSYTRNVHNFTDTMTGGPEFNS